MTSARSRPNPQQPTPSAFASSCTSTRTCALAANSASTTIRFAHRSQPGVGVADLEAELAARLGDVVIVDEGRQSSRRPVRVRSRWNSPTSSAAISMTEAGIVRPLIGCARARRSGSSAVPVRYGGAYAGCISASSEVPCPGQYRCIHSDRLILEETQHGPIHRRLPVRRRPNCGVGTPIPGRHLSLSRLPQASWGPFSRFRGVPSGCGDDRWRNTRLRRPVFLSPLRLPRFRTQRRRNRSERRIPGCP